MPRPGRRRATRRSTALPGHAYVYLNYGIHCLVNVVTEAHGSPAAVLIRALDPLDGIEVMRRRRARADEGPQRAGQAAIADSRPLPRPRQSDDGDGDHAGGESARSARRSAVRRGPRVPVGPIAWGPRIGIRVGTETPWRAWVDGIRRSRGLSTRNGGGHGIGRASPSQVNPRSYLDSVPSAVARRKGRQFVASSEPTSASTPAQPWNRAHHSASRPAIVFGRRSVGSCASRARTVAG